MSQIQATATIITHNEALHIAACIRSVDWFAEVLVIDSGSSDETVALARAAGARVIENPWPGFGLQKQFAVDHASHSWVFSLDADERVSEALKHSMRALLATEPAKSAYQVNRCNHFMGRPLRHGEGYPDWCLRLFNRNQARWSDDVVHEKVLCDGQASKLQGDLDHYSQESLAAYIGKQNRYTTLQAEGLFARGKDASLIKLTLSPLVRFIKFYLFRRGFLDGVPGLVHIALGCFNSFVKYAKLRELCLRNGKSH
ncbi:MAG: glycosyltransferase involved in cell wall biosynthesis [Candidatus Pseudothioglobus sp.]|jgi:glycosyltransferase involved in cell wall biosynthesis